MANPDLDTLLQHLLPVAEQMLSKVGTFFPFGALMSKDGEVEFVGASTGDETSSPQERLDLLVRALRERLASRQIRATGICMSVRATAPGQNEKTPAICVRLEHDLGEAVDVFIPHKKGLFGGIKYGEQFAVEGKHQFFTGAAQQDDRS